MLLKVGRVGLVGVMLALASCSAAPSPQTQECRDYIACYRKVGGTGDLTATYEASGSCWTTNAPMAQSCTAACVSSLGNLRVMFPSSGC